MFDGGAHRLVLWAVRAGLIGAISFSLAFPDLPQFAGKGMALRAPFYLFPLVIVPVIWRVRGRRAPYPSLIDACVAAPFLFDTAANVFNFYENYRHTDDVLHFVNWVVLIGGVALALARTYLRPIAIWAMAYGIGALAIIWWEAIEWLVQELGTNGLNLTYGDTIGDLIASSTGGAIGAAAAVAWLHGSRPAYGVRSPSTSR